MSTGIDPTLFPHLAQQLQRLGDRISVLEGLQVFPDVVPDDLVASVEPELSLH